MKWDFIVVHESGHERFGNNITTKDLADMWVHEGFTIIAKRFLLITPLEKELRMNTMPALAKESGTTALSKQNTMSTTSEAVTCIQKQATCFTPSDTALTTTRCLEIFSEG